ncbi:hypothetical protein TcWFU_009628 [Taenia crassiceps]|uniref:Uncharacterized protein n=1 Tax=Taenia crassiceps TaxID=6207 RepID=A0ABR4QIL4_9CEST
MVFISVLRVFRSFFTDCIFSCTKGVKDDEIIRRRRPSDPLPSPPRQVQRADEDHVYDEIKSFPYSDLSEASTFGEMPTPVPLTLEERWRQMMSAYQTKAGEAEHVYDEVASDSDSSIVSELVVLCTRCGVMWRDNGDEVFKKGHYRYGRQRLSREERRRNLAELVKYLEREAVLTERLIRSYLKGEIG